MTNIEIREIFQNQHDEVAREEGQKLLLSHCGVFSTELIRALADRLNVIAVSHGANRSLQKRLFSIMLEGLKNLKLYAEEDEQGNKIGFIIVSKSDTRYTMHLSNIVTNGNFHKVEKYLKQINSFSQAELEKTYKEILTNELLGLEGKKGRGFINARMKSDNKIDYFMNELNENLLLLNCYLVVNI